MTSLCKLIATAAAVAVLLVPTAFASNGGRPDDRAVGPRSAPVTETVRPDDRGGYRGIPVVIQAPAAATHDGFDFGDAGIGAAAGAGLLLVVTGSALLLLRRRARVAL